jgi:hypothetical protein
LTAHAAFIYFCLSATNILAVNLTNAFQVAIKMLPTKFAHTIIRDFVSAEIITRVFGHATGARGVCLTLPILIILPVLANATFVFHGYTPALASAVKLFAILTFGTFT